MAAIGVLGPVAVQGRTLRSRVGRVLLARMVIGDDVVAVDELADAAWGDDVPPSVRSTLKSHLSRLRSTLRDAVGYDAVASHPGGYRLTVPDESIDARVFEAAVARSRTEPPQEATTTLREALCLWRGPAFGDLRYEEFAAGEAARLEELRLLALEERVDADLSLGTHRQLIPELTALTGEHPLRERLALALMRALHADGRQRDALREFARYRSGLVEASGLEPGAAIVGLHDQMLAGTVDAGASDRPAIRYATTRSGLHVGYVLRGAGPPWLLGLGADAHVSVAHLSDHPTMSAGERQLAAAVGLIRMDRPGIGLSDPPASGGAPTMEEWTDAALAVADHAGIGRFVALGNGWSAPPAIAVAAHHADRVAALVILNGFARFVRAEDHPIGIPQSLVERFRDSVLDTSVELMPNELDDVLLHAPSLADDPQFRAWWRRAGQQGASPAVSRAHFTLIVDADVRHLLAGVAVPTLVIQRRDNRYVRAAHGRDIAARIPGATYVEVDGADQLLAAGDPAPVVAAIQRFLQTLPNAGRRG